MAVHLTTKKFSALHRQKKQPQTHRHGPPAHKAPLALDLMNSCKRALMAAPVPIRGYGGNLLLDNEGRLVYLDHGLLSFVERRYSQVGPAYATQTY
eukprot:scaffold50975_cov55-Prasinocladus_malaysianus.AAC.1